MQWLADPIELSPEQIAVLSDAHDHTARPIHPLGDRTVHRGSGLLVAD